MKILKQNLKLCLLISYTLMSYLFINEANAQVIEMDYYPEKPAHVNQVNYDKGKITLERLYDYKRGRKNKDFLSLDLITLAECYLYMGVPKNEILNILGNFKAENEEQFCDVILGTIVDDKNPKSLKYYEVLGDDFLSIIDNCKNIEISQFKASNVSTNEYKKEGLNVDLMKRLDLLLQKDQKYRKSLSKIRKNANEQRILDNEVINEIISIIEEYGYPGKDLVGDKRGNYATFFMEHTRDLSTQEKYLPIIIEAFKNKQVDAGSVRMLLDRIQTSKTGKQLFGSHARYPFESKETIESIRDKYGL